jgi:hypothetical protein
VTDSGNRALAQGSVPLFVLGSLPERPWLELLLAIGSGPVFRQPSSLSICSPAWRLWRHARDWPQLQLGHQPVWIANDLGPAVFGLFSQPHHSSALAGRRVRGERCDSRWHTNASTSPRAIRRCTRRRWHSSSCFPGISALLWQQRRLRFALEVDCDARVLSHGTNPAEYGDALLAVSQRETQAPVGAIALIERTSQLERRIDIMTNITHRHRAWIAAACLMLAGACVFAATAIEAPPRTNASPLKPAPTGGAMKLGRHFEEMLAARYPGLLEQDRAGTAAVVVLLNEDWSIAKAAQVNFEESIDKLQLNKDVFGVLGIAVEAVPYVGHLGMQSPDNPAHRVLIVFTERSIPGERFVSHVAWTRLRSIARYSGDSSPRRSMACEPARGSGCCWIATARSYAAARSRSIHWSGTSRSKHAFPRSGRRKVTLTPVTDDAGEPLLDSAGKRK